MVPGVGVSRDEDPPRSRAYRVAEVGNQSIIILRVECGEPGAFLTTVVRAVRYLAKRSTGYGNSMSDGESGWLETGSGDKNIMVAGS